MMGVDLCLGGHGHFPAGTGDRVMDVVADKIGNRIIVEGIAYECIGDAVLDCAKVDMR